MVAENVRYDNIDLIIKQLKLSVEQGCKIFSFRSIAEKALEYLCIVHYYATSLHRGDRFIYEDNIDRANKAFFLTSKLLSPHYLTCYSLANSVSTKPITASEFEHLCVQTQLWLFFTELLHRHFLEYFDFLRINMETLELVAGPNWSKIDVEEAKFESFLTDYYLSQACGVQYSIDQLYSLALSDAIRADRFIDKEKKFRPSIVLRGLFSLFEEWDAIYRGYPLHEEVDGQLGRQMCNLPIDFSSEECRKILNRKGIGDDIEKTLKPAVLTATQAKEYILSMETKKSPPDACTYPLWDYPLLEVNDCYLSNPILLTEAFQELSYRFIASSSNSLSSYTHAEHERLIEKTVSILKELGFSSIQKNIKFRINRQDTAQFDILAKKSHGFWHFECKTKRLPWRWRMFHVSKELEKEALDFLEESSLSLDKWNKKTQSLKEYLEQTASCTNPEISSIVVTDAPNPASCVCSYVDIVWVDRLQKYLDQKISQ